MSVGVDRKRSPSGVTIPPSKAKRRRWPPSTAVLAHCLRAPTQSAVTAAVAVNPSLLTQLERWKRSLGADRGDRCRNARIHALTGGVDHDSLALPGPVVASADRKPGRQLKPGHVADSRFDTPSVLLGIR